MSTEKNNDYYELDSRMYYLVAKHGRMFTKFRAPSQAMLVWRTTGRCYDNAYRAACLDPDRYGYFEGYAASTTGITYHHASVYDRELDAIIDPTWYHYRDNPFPPPRNGKLIDFNPEQVKHIGPYHHGLVLHTNAVKYLREFTVRWLKQPRLERFTPLMVLVFFMDTRPQVVGTIDQWCLFDDHQKEKHDVVVVDYSSGNCRDLYRSSVDLSQFSGSH